MMSIGNSTSVCPSLCQQSSHIKEHVEDLSYKEHIEDLSTIDEAL